MHVYTDTLPTMNCWLDTLDKLYDAGFVRPLRRGIRRRPRNQALRWTYEIPQISENIFGVEGDRNLMIWASAPPPSMFFHIQM